LFYVVVANSLAVSIQHFKETIGQEFAFFFFHSYTHARTSPHPPPPSCPGKCEKKQTEEKHADVSEDILEFLFFKKAQTLT